MCCPWEEQRRRIREPSDPAKKQMWICLLEKKYIQLVVSIFGFAMRKEEQLLQFSPDSATLPPRAVITPHLINEGAASPGWDLERRSREKAGVARSGRADSQLGYLPSESAGK